MASSHPRRIFAVGLVLVAVSLTACGANAHTKALQTSLVSIDAARDGFVKWDEHHQASIVEKATSAEEGAAALKSYRAQRAAVIEGFTVAYSALAAAALDDNMGRLTEALNAASHVYQLIKDLMGAKDAP